MYKPDQRKLPARILTDSGWAIATFHAGARASLCDLLNRDVDFLPLTSVTIDGVTSDFLALRREAITLVLPTLAEGEGSKDPRNASQESARIRCLLPGGTLSGTLQVLRGQRVSDFLARVPGFVLLTDCSLRFAQGNEATFPQAIINGRRLLGVSESSPRPMAGASTRVAAHQA